MHLIFFIILLFIMPMHDFEYARKNPNAKVLNSRDELEDKSLNEPLDKYKVDKNMKGVEYMPDSLQSQKLFHSNDVQDYIKENLEALIEANGNPLPDEGLYYTFIPSPDAYIGIQSCFIHGARITKDGYFEANIVDKYDFEKRDEKPWVETLAHDDLSDSFKDATNNALNKLNNEGYKMQELGLLQNYFEIYHIKEKLW